MTAELAATMNLLVSPGNPPIHNPISMRKTPVVVFLFGCLVVPMNMPDGIDQLEPVGPFLNGTLPSGTPNTPFPYEFVDAYPGLRFDDPLTFTPEPGTNRMFVGSRQGVIESFDNSSTVAVKNTFLDLTGRVAMVWDGGFLGHAFHPDWGDVSSPNADYFYVYYCYAALGANYPTTYETSDGFYDCYLRLSRFTKSPGSTVADPNSELVMFNVELHNASHRGGGMFFRDDGFLYLSIGDQFRYETAQNIEDNFEGGVLRIDVDSQGASVSHPPRRVMGTHVGGPNVISGVGYFIPNDNPFLSPSGDVFEEFWTLGNRNPHRMTRDMGPGLGTDRIWSGEVGQSTREEINIIEGGFNYQWPFREGLTIGVRERPQTILGIERPPLLDFSRAEANAIIGGYVYRGTEHPALTGRYICGDYGQSRIWAITYDEATATATKDELFSFTPGLLATFGQDHGGEIYACGLGIDVPIYRLAVAPIYPEAPVLLSQTGIFTNMATLDVPNWLIPYDVNTELWSDGAVKRRWLAVPNDGVADTAGEQIGYSENEEWTFPVGTVFVKHFETPTGQRLETRFLVHGERTYYGITYKWNAAGTDATLLTDSATESVTIDAVTFDYHYPSRSDCLVCHNRSAGFVNGLRSRQLNRDFIYPLSGRTDNQLRALDQVGLFNPSPDLSKLDRIVTNVPLHDADASVELRARSYLDANCAQCHRPNQGHNNVDARSIRGLPWQGILNAGVADDLGITGARVVDPGDLTTSILYERVNRTGGCCSMPPLGRGRLHGEAVDLLAFWIQSLEPTATGGSVAQSSTYNDVPVAERAVDGGLNGNLFRRSVTRTNSELEPWWQADLGTDFVIDRVRIFNRTDSATWRLANFYVFVSPTPFLHDDVALTLAAPGVQSTLFPGIAGIDEVFEFSPSVVGRYIRVQLTGQNPLSLTEVQFDGHTPAAGPMPRSMIGSRIASKADDAEEQLATANVILNSSDLELGTQGTNDQLVGMRFGVDVPPGSQVLSAYVQFSVDERSTGPASLSIGIEATDDALPAVTQAQDLSSRSRSQTSVSWAPPDWPTVAATGVEQRTPDLSVLIQEIIDRPGWQIGNSLLLLIDGTGTRTAESHDGSLGFAPRLVMEFAALNPPPIVEAGPSRTAVQGATIAMQGSVTDASAVVMTQWNQINGPTAGISIPSDPTTDVTFPVPGFYVLELTADDGEYLRRDTVAVAVHAGSVLFETRVANGGDDAEQRFNGLDRTNRDLELGVDGTRTQFVGARFATNVPRGATITDARLVFTVDEVSTGASQLEIRAAAEDNALLIRPGRGLNLLTRNMTAASVAWSPPEWLTVGESGVDQTSPNLASILQEVIDREAWRPGNRVLLILRGTGTRTAESFEGMALGAPLLRVTWQQRPQLETSARRACRAVEQR